MSLYALYTVADPQPSPTSTDTGSSILNISDTSQSFQDTVFVLLIIGAETAIMVTDKNRGKKNTPQTITLFRHLYAKAQAEYSPHYRGRNNYDGYSEAKGTSTDGLFLDSKELKNQKSKTIKRKNEIAAALNSIFVTKTLVKSTLMC